MKGFDYKVSQQLRKIYGDSYEESYAESMLALIHAWDEISWEPVAPLTQKNVYLSTYSDSFIESGVKPLQTLKTFLDRYGKEIFTDIHLLSMFGPHRDNDFSVSDHFDLDPTLGTWEDIEALGDDYRLMYNFVANHVADDNLWFQRFLAGDPDYKDFFIEEGMIEDLSNTWRASKDPLFVDYDSPSGVKHIWSTWGNGTVDLNVKNYQVLEILTDALVAYVYHGASSVRIDAIGALWKKSGTSNAYLPETHQILTLWRIILDYLQPNVQVLPLTNGSPRENSNYFGNGHNEASLIYQWALEPLVLYTFLTGDISVINKWAASLKPVSNEASYFNFIINNEVIDTRSVDGVLTYEQKQKMIDKVEQTGGHVVFEDRQEGGRVLRELHTTYWTALTDPLADHQKSLDEYIAAHFIMISLIGVPAIYYHTMVGSRAAVTQHDQVDFTEFEREMKDANLAQVYNRLKELIIIRGKHTAFSPYSGQKVLDVGDKIFAIERSDEKTGERIYCYVNVSGRRQTIELPSGINLLTNKAIMAKPYQFEAYEYMWLQVNQARH